MEKINSYNSRGIKINPIDKSGGITNYFSHQNPRSKYYHKLYKCYHALNDKLNIVPNYINLTQTINKYLKEPQHRDDPYLTAMREVIKSATNIKIEYIHYFVFKLFQDNNGKYANMAIDIIINNLGGVDNFCDNLDEKMIKNTNISKDDIKISIESSINKIKTIQNKWRLFSTIIEDKKPNKFNIQRFKDEEKGYEYLRYCNKEKSVWFRVDNLKEVKRKEANKFKKIDSISDKTLRLTMLDPNEKKYINNDEVIANTSYIHKLLVKLSLNNYFILAIPDSRDTWFTKNGGTDLFSIILEDQNHIPLKLFEEPIKQLSELNQNLAYHRDIKLENMTKCDKKINEPKIYFIDCDGITSINNDGNHGKSPKFVGTDVYCQLFVMNFIRHNLNKTNHNKQELSAHMKFHDEYALLITLFIIFLKKQNKDESTKFYYTELSNKDQGLTPYLSNNKTGGRLFDKFLKNCIESEHTEYVRRLMTNPKEHIKNEINIENKKRLFLSDVISFNKDF